MQNILYVLSNKQFKQKSFSESISNKLDDILDLYDLNKDQINEVYDFVSNNKLNPKVYSIINRHYPIDIPRLDLSVYLPSKYFRALCNYSEFDLSFKNNSLLLHFLLSLEFEEACFLMGFESVKNSFDKKNFENLLGKDVVEQFIKIKNISNF